jgi:LuxR family maltose regulon positive regulatory protein
MITHCLADAQRLAGETDAARKTYGQAARLSQATGNLFAAVTAVRNLAELQQEQGQLHQAAANYRLALRLAQQDASGQGARSTAAANVHIWLGRLLHEWNELEAATRHLEGGITISRRSEYPIGLIMGQAALAQVLQLQGKESAAWRLIPQAEQVVLKYNQSQSGLHSYVKMVQTQLHLARARDHSDQRALGAAVRWAQEQSLSAEQTFSYHSRVALAFASLLIIQGRQQVDETKVQSALQVLDRLLEPSQAAGRTGYVIKLLVLKGLANQVRGELDQAIAALRQALWLAEPEKFMRPFVEEGAPMTELLQQTLKTDLPHHLSIYTNVLLKALTAYGIKVQLAPAPTKLTTSAPLLHTFTDRELDVLRLIAAGRSNRQIAQELVVAASTVKTHINNIYRKLQVHSRTQALARLRELQLS